jgi:hypothetical protein
MEFIFYHEYSEVYCNHCGYDQFDPFNENYCELCMGEYSMHFTCELCLDLYDLEENIEMCPIYYDNAYIIISFLQKRLLIKNLIKYANILLDKYYNPKSKYIQYIINNFDKNNRFKEIGYIDKYNNLKLFKITK